MKIQTQENWKMAAAGVPLLTAPVLLISPGYAITDNVVESTSFVPVEIPEYVNAATGDNITLFMNGYFVAYHQLDMATESLPLTVQVPTSSFNFTGYAAFYYIVSGVNFSAESGNANTSTHGQYRVYRTAFPNPDSASNAPDPPPKVQPPLYNAASMNAGVTFDVTVDLTHLSVTAELGDDVGVYFELVAATADKADRRPQFYSLDDGSGSGGFRAPLSANDLAAGKVTVNVPASKLKGIDGNNGVAYYAHFIGGVMELQSMRTVVTIDTVPPFRP